MAPVPNRSLVVIAGDPKWILSVTCCAWGTRYARFGIPAAIVLPNKFNGARCEVFCYEEALAPSLWA